MLSDDGTVATKEGLLWRSAVCGGHEMRLGRHYATFTIRTDHGGDVCLGVVGPGFDPPTKDSGGGDTAQGWVLYTLDGDLYHAEQPI